MGVGVGEQVVGVGLGAQELAGPACPKTLFLPTGPGPADSQSWASCMTTSLQLAQECLRDGLPEPSEPPQPLEGLEMFAQTIETGKQAPPGYPATPKGKLCLPFTTLPNLRPPSSLLSASKDQGDLPGHCREGGALPG